MGAFEERPKRDTRTLKQSVSGASTPQKQKQSDPNPCTLSRTARNCQLFDERQTPNCKSERFIHTCRRILCQTRKYLKLNNQRMLTRKGLKRDKKLSFACETTSEEKSSHSDSLNPPRNHQRFGCVVIHVSKRFKNKTGHPYFSRKSSRSNLRSVQSC